MNKFKVAFAGLFNGFKHKSILIQWILALFTILFGILLGLNYMQMILIILCIGLVLGFEYLNTAIEKTCDLISEEYDIKIKFIKDISAASVLIQAISAALIFVIIIVNVLGG